MTLIIHDLYIKPISMERISSTNKKKINGEDVIDNINLWDLSKTESFHHLLHNLDRHRGHT